MNALERAETKAELLRREFLPTWTAIRSAVEDLVGSYNRTGKGRVFPATVRSQEGDRAVIVSCGKGLATDAFKSRDDHH